MSLPQNSSELDQSSNDSVNDNHETSNHNHHRSHSLIKLRKLPPVPIRGSHIIAELRDNNNLEGNEDYDHQKNEETDILDASSLGLNHIRSRSRFSTHHIVDSSGANDADNIQNMDTGFISFFRYLIFMT